MENVKVITIAYEQAACIWMIHTGCFTETLAKLKEQEKACLNKETIRLYINAYEAIEKAKPAIDRLMIASEADFKQRSQSKSN